MFHCLFPGCDRFILPDGIPGFDRIEWGVRALNALDDLMVDVDENLPVELADLLQEAGYDAMTVNQQKRNKQLNASTPKPKA